MKCASGVPLKHTVYDAQRFMIFSCSKLKATFFSMIPYHHWMAKTSTQISWPRNHNSEAKNIKKWADRGPDAAYAAKNLLKLLQIAVTVEWKHLSIPCFLEAFLQYLRIYWSILNVLKQPKGFAATCRNLQQPLKSLKSAILKQNGNWPMTKTNWNSITMTSEALRLLFLICCTFCSNRKALQQPSKDCSIAKILLKSAILRQIRYWYSFITSGAIRHLSHSCWASNNLLQQLKDFAATCQSLRNLIKSLKSKICS